MGAYTKSLTKEVAARSEIPCSVSTIFVPWLFPASFVALQLRFSQQVLVTSRHDTQSVRNNKLTFMLDFLAKWHGQT